MIKQNIRTKVKITMSTTSKQKQNNIYLTIYNLSDIQSWAILVKKNINYISTSSQS